MSGEAAFHSADGLTYFDVVTIKDTCQYEELRGLRGHLAGHSRVPTDTSWSVFVFGPDMCWRLNREDFDPTGERLTEEDVMSDVHLRVSSKGELLG